MPQITTELPQAATTKNGQRRVLRLTDPVMQGDDVTEVERRLVAHGDETQVVDGKYGSATEEGVRRFQAREGLRVTGEVDTDTHAALIADPDAPPAGTELFRLVALRAPEPPVGTLPRITLELPAEPDGDTTDGDGTDGDGGDHIPVLNLVALRSTPAVAGLTAAGLNLAELEKGGGSATTSGTRR